MSSESEQLSEKNQVISGYIHQFVTVITTGPALVTEISNTTVESFQVKMLKMISIDTVPHPVFMTLDTYNFTVLYDIIILGKIT